MKEVVREEWNIASSEETATPNSAGSPGSADYRAAFTVALAGWTLDAFDFFLVAFLLTTIGRDFHQSDARIALSLTATLACRPIGAVIFGLLGDRYGRKLPLMLNLALYACVQVLTALAPTFLTFLAARALFGVCMGGQWGLGTTLAMEKVPSRLRGVLSGVLQQGYSAGYLLAGFACALLEPRFGWRSLFYVACIPALATALYLWFRVEESHIWRKTAQSSNSWSTLAKSTVSNWPLLIFFLAFMIGMQMSSHGTQDMYPTFLQRQWGFTPWQKSNLISVAMVGAILGGACFGFLSDKLGRRRSIILAFVIAICIVPLWAFAPNVPLLFVGAFLLQFCVQGAWGVVPAYMAELAPDNVRAFLPGFANQCGVVLAGFVVYLEAATSHRTSYARAMAFSAVTIFLLAILVTSLGKEKRAVEFGQRSHGP
jgi:SHS family lactate transporter-like MFS transporter